MTVKCIVILHSFSMIFLAHAIILCDLYTHYPGASLWAFSAEQFGKQKNNNALLLFEKKQEHRNVVNWNNGSLDVFDLGPKSGTGVR